MFPAGRRYRRAAHRPAGGFGQQAQPGRPGGAPGGGGAAPGGAGGAGAPGRQRQGFLRGGRGRHGIPGVLSGIPRSSSGTGCWGWTGCSTPSRTSRSPPWPPSTATRSAAGWSWRSPPATGSWPGTPASACPRPSWGCSRAGAEPCALRAWPGRTTPSNGSPEASSIRPTPPSGWASWTRWWRRTWCGKRPWTCLARPWPGAGTGGPGTCGACFATLRGPDPGSAA